MLLISRDAGGRARGAAPGGDCGGGIGGVRQIVYTSFIGIDDPPTRPKCGTIISRPNGSSAPRLGWTMLRDAHYADAMVLMAGPGVMQTGVDQQCRRGREAMVWRDDCIDCAVAVLVGEGTQDALTTLPDPLQSFRDVTALMARATGRRLAYEPVDDEAQYAIFDAMGIPRRPSMTSPSTAFRGTAMTWSRSAGRSVKGSWKSVPTTSSG
jgi:NAD(P)H dehydrogenase (quinone)